jgi:hypothetical protein
MANVTGPGRCRACGKPLPVQEGRGRQRQYCDASCRSAARRTRAASTPEPASVNPDLTSPPRKANLDIVAGRDRTTEGAPLAERLLGSAGRLAGELRGTAGSPVPVGAAAPIAAVAAARDLASTVEEALRATVSAARTAGHTWQEIGEVLGTSRQAAFQRFGRPVDPRTGVEMATQVLPGAAEHAIGVLDDIVGNRWDAARRDFGAAMLDAVTGERLAAVWARVRGMVGGYEHLGEPLTFQMGDYTVVDLPLHFEAGEMTARISYDPAGKVAGLLIKPPGSV